MKTGRINIGITGTGSIVGQRVIKCIQLSKMRDDLKLLGFDYFDDTAGSEWVDKHHVLPDIMKEGMEKKWLESIMDIISTERIKVLFIGAHFELRLFAKHRDMIESKTGCVIVVSDPKVIETASDKYLTYLFLKENGLDYPKTFLPEELEKCEIEFPCIVKPRRGNRSIDLHIIKDRKRLNDILPYVKEPIIQELVGDPSLEYTCGTICLDGKVRDVIVLRRDLRDGNTQTAYHTADTPEIIGDYVRAAAQRLKPFGPCNFQLRLDKDGRPKLFEINARHSGTTYMRALFGLNEIEIILSHMLGRPLEKASLKQGVVKRYYDELFIEDRP